MPVLVEILIIDISRKWRNFYAVYYRKVFQYRRRPALTAKMAAFHYQSKWNFDIYDVQYNEHFRYAWPTHVIFDKTIFR